MPAVAIVQYRSDSEQSQIAAVPVARINQKSGSRTQMEVVEGRNGQGRWRQNLSTTAKKGITAEIHQIINEGSVGNLAMFYLVPVFYEGGYGEK